MLMETLFLLEFFRCHLLGSPFSSRSLPLSQKVQKVWTAWASAFLEVTVLDISTGQTPLSQAGGLTPRTERLGIFCLIISPGKNADASEMGCYELWA